MEQKQIEEIRARYEKTIPALQRAIFHCRKCDCIPTPIDMNDEDAIFIAHIREDVPLLIEALEDAESRASEFFYKYNVSETECAELQAKLDNAIELLCKVGEKAILIFDKFGELFKTTDWNIIKIEITEDEIYIHFICILTEPYSIEVRNIKDIGKTVFFTREEAEKALEERESK